MKFIDDEINQGAQWVRKEKGVFRAALSLARSRSPAELSYPSTRVRRRISSFQKKNQSTRLCPCHCVQLCDAMRERLKDKQASERGDQTEGETKFFFFWLISEALLRQWNWIKLRPTRQHTTLSSVALHKAVQEEMTRDCVCCLLSRLEKRKMDFVFFFALVIEFFRSHFGHHTPAVERDSQNNSQRFIRFLFLAFRS